jgi:ribosomal protein S18 acetylase RimI-like enzyme
MFEERIFPPAFIKIVPSESDGEPASGEIGTTIYLRSAVSSDESFLYRTFAGTRSDEMALTGWSAEQQESFLRMQFEAQRKSYLAQLPNAEYWIISCEEAEAGRLILNRTESTIHIVDIALIPEFRKRRIGSALMKTIMKEASQSARAVTLHVERFNPALQWYERLGFSVVSSGPIYLEMIWRAVSESARIAPSDTDCGVAYVYSSD